MVREIEDHRVALEAICRRFQVRRLSKDDPACAAQIHEHQRIIAFRNILQLELPTLHLRVKSALRNL
jgi:hypothetical protein